MDDKQYKKLMRNFTIMWFLVLVILIFIWLSNRSDASQLRQYVNTRVGSVQGQIDQLASKPINNEKPKDGVNGADGQTTIVHTTEVITRPAAEPKEGQKGDKGDDGAPAPDLQIQVNEKTGDLETKYSTDDFWRVLLPCDHLQVGCKK